MVHLLSSFYPTYRVCEAPQTLCEAKYSFRRLENDREHLEYMLQREGFAILGSQGNGDAQITCY